MYSKENISELLEILLPQYFDSVIDSIKTALWQIDPSWKKGQFDIFSKHFKLQFWRSVFVKRFLLNDARKPLLDETILLERILNIANNMSDMEKAAFYGEVLSEYIMLCPVERFPIWADEEKYKPNWLAHWNLHSNTWQTIY